MPHQFLSDEWFDAVEALRDEAPPPPEEVARIAINVRVTGGPDGRREMHFARGRFDRGLVKGARTTITLPHATARAMLVDGDPSAAITAFMKGEIRLDGDITKLLSFDDSGSSMFIPTAEQFAFLQKLREITV